VLIELCCGVVKMLCDDEKIYVGLDLDSPYISFCIRRFHTTVQVEHLKIDGART
jgi:hypothetical protein